MVIAHFGIAVSLAGMASESAFSIEKLVALHEGEATEVGPWEVTPLMMAVGIWRTRGAYPLFEEEERQGLEAMKVAIELGNDVNAKWDVHMAQSLDALGGNPAFTVNKVNENTIHTGEICLDGLNCDISTLTGEPRDRSFAEFPSIDIDSKGAAYITYNDSTNQLPAPYVMIARQLGGASLFAAVGSLTGTGGNVTISSPASGDPIRSASMIRPTSRCASACRTPSTPCWRMS